MANFCGSGGKCDASTRSCARRDGSTEDVRWIFDKCIRMRERWAKVKGATIHGLLGPDSKTTVLTAISFDKKLSQLRADGRRLIDESKAHNIKDPSLNRGGDGGFVPGRVRGESRENGADEAP